MLGVMEANVALMNLENVRILKEMRNSVNRKVNCETANIGKTVSAAVRQVEDIQLIEKKIGLSKLPQSLQEIARVRLEHPDMPLKDLGELLTPPVENRCQSPAPQDQRNSRKAKSVGGIIMKKDVVVQMSDSMEETPIAHLVQLANQFSSQIYFEMDTKRVNAKSIMGMMSLVLTAGDSVTICADGEDQEKAIAKLEEFLTA